jgi:hypothetical protein
MMRIHYKLIGRGLALVCLPALLWLACGSKLNAPADDNPYDPENPAYVPPLTNLTVAPVSGSTIAGDTCRIAWGGNAQAAAFAWRISLGAWSAWTESTTVMLRNLPEGENVFYLKARDLAGNETCMDSVLFRVNSVVGPALVLQPREMTVAANTTFQLTVYADEMPDSCVLADLHLEYDRNNLELVSIDQGDFFGQNNGTILFAQRDTLDTISILTGTTGGTPAWAGGSGPLAVLLFNTRSMPGTAYVRFSNTRQSVVQKYSADFNYSQHTVVLNQKINAVIIIQ